MTLFRNPVNMRRLVFLAVVVLLAWSQESHFVVAESGKTEHKVSEEWSWRDSDGNNGSGGSNYSYVDDMRDLEDYDDDDDVDEDDEDDLEEDEDDFDGVPNFEMDDNEDEDSCEYSCPRYYRPVCVLRNGHMVTYATPCEYHNQVRCSIVEKSRGATRAPTFQFYHNGNCVRKSSF